jgi:hypothetical protein
MADTTEVVTECILNTAADNANHHGKAEHTAETWMMVFDWVIVSEDILLTVLVSVSFGLALR